MLKADTMGLAWVGGDRKDQDSGLSNQEGFHDRIFQVEHRIGRRGVSARIDLTKFFGGLIQ
jgi:hypothetical protein